MKRRNIVILVLLIAMTGVIYTQAFTLTPLEQVATYYEADTSASDRTVSNFVAKPMGKNKILITFTLSDGTQDANVTLQPLDQWGNILNSTGPGSNIQYRVGAGALQPWKSYPTPDEEMYFYYEYNSTGPDYSGPVEIRVLFTIYNITLDYEMCLIEVRDY